jgi:hypothetical protein
MVLWWIAVGHEPTIAEAVERLMLLREKGASPKAFTFGEAYPAPDADNPGKSFSFTDTCPA